MRNDEGVHSYERTGFEDHLVYTTQAWFNWILREQCSRHQNRQKTFNDYLCASRISIPQGDVFTSSLNA